MGFTKLHLSSPLTRVLERQGYTSPTPIQEKAIPVVMSGKDVMGLAQTGTGKTAAFALPILERLMKALPDKQQRGHRHPRVLVLAPTRELATQIGESFATYGVETGLSHTTIFGGVSQFHQVRAIQHGIDILVATPGRLIDLMEQRLIDLSRIEVFILDEADRMLDMGFIAPIRRIASALPTKRQTLMFSATMDKQVNQLAQTLLREPVLVEVPRQGVASEQVEQLLYFVQHHEKQALLTHLLRQPEMERVVVFTKTKHGAERVGKRLTRAGLPAETIHGNKAQNARTRALDRFRGGYSKVLVATDVAARGLDVDGITHVINMDLPMEPDAYVHRIGRTGRAGATGKSISFCDSTERGLLRDVERLLKKSIPTAPLPEFSRDIPDVVPEREHAGRRTGGRDDARDVPRGPKREKPGKRGSEGLRRPEGYVPPAREPARADDRPQRDDARREQPSARASEHPSELRSERAANGRDLRGGPPIRRAFDAKPASREDDRGGNWQQSIPSEREARSPRGGFQRGRTAGPARGPARGASRGGEGSRGFGNEGRGGSGRPAYGKPAYGAKEDRGESRGESRGDNQGERRSAPTSQGARGGARIDPIRGQKSQSFGNFDGPRPGGGVRKLGRGKK
jgi:ATP-dependent RNA helicase RhlE